jgi:glycosyltransferase involved in cell wall biosynthesis
MPAEPERSEGGERARGERSEPVRVFVGIPTRNRPHLVPNAIRSVLAQTVQDFRVVVSDNQSEPAARESVERFVRELGDPRVTYVLQPEDKGEYGQGRFFLAEGRGADYLTILHDDDVIEPRYLETALFRLDGHPELVAFFANPWIFGTDGLRSEERTVRYRLEHGREGHPGGAVDLLAPLLKCGMCPISGTVFRTRALVDSGFVDDDCFGNYPFEFNLLLRLGEHGGRAWFERETLIGYCFHEGQLRNTLKLQFNEHVVSTMIKLLERRRFRGDAELWRRKTLGFNHRNYASILLARDDVAAARRHLARALAVFPLSWRTWLHAAAGFVAPLALRDRVRAQLSSFS